MQQKVLIWALLTLVILALVIIISYPYHLQDRPMFYEFDDPIAESRVVAGDEYWDVLFKVTDYEEMDPTLWSEFEVVVTSSSGKELFRTTTVNEDAPSKYDNGTDGTVDVEAWYIDTGSDSFMEKGDYLVFTGLTEEFQGATLRIYHVTQQFGNRVADDKFPSSFE